MSYQQSHLHTINQSKVMLAVRYQCWDFRALCNQCATYDLHTPKHLIDICFSSHVTRIQVLFPWPLTQRPYMWNPKASLSLTHLMQTLCKIWISPISWQFNFYVHLTLTLDSLSYWKIKTYDIIYTSLYKTWTTFIKMNEKFALPAVKQN